MVLQRTTTRLVGVGETGTPNCGRESPHKNAIVFPTDRSASTGASWSCPSTQPATVSGHKGPVASNGPFAYPVAKIGESPCRYALARFAQSEYLANWPPCIGLGSWVKMSELHGNNDSASRVSGRRLRRPYGMPSRLRWRTLRVPCVVGNRRPIWILFSAFCTSRRPIQRSSS